MVKENIARNPFRFVGCMELKEMLGLKARDEEDLMNLVEEVPLESIYYHVYGYLLRHDYLLGPYPNDFASWVHIEVRDSMLAEKLGLLDPVEYDTLEGLRATIVELISNHLDQVHGIPRVIMGQPFFFMKSNIIEVPTKIEVKSLREFREALEVVDSSVIFNHFFASTEEPRKVVDSKESVEFNQVFTPAGKLRRRMDFVKWVEEDLGMEQLAQNFRVVNPFMMSLEKLRTEMMDICDRYLPPITTPY